MNKKYVENVFVKSIYYKRLIRNKGTYIMKEDGDDLILLDGCRFDIFKKNLILYLED